MTHENLVKMVEQGLGPKRLASLKKDEDSYQNFWIGVLKSLPRSDKYEDKIPYLIRSGYGEISDAYRVDARKEFRKWCPKCRKFHSVSRIYCPKCGEELDVVNRNDSLDTEYAPQIADRQWNDLDLGMDIRKFVQYVNRLYRAGEVDGRFHHVTVRWLVNRVDLFEDNHSVTLAQELGCTPQNISRIKKQIRELFSEYYAGVNETLTETLSA
jgi:hypothetical protein